MSQEEVSQRLRAVCDLNVPSTRRDAGRHEYDGVVQDLSPDGVRRGLSALGAHPAAGADHDEAALNAAETKLRVRFGELQLHRVNPLWHIENLDLSCNDRDYAPEAERGAARRRHLDQWPDAVDAAIAALHRVPADLASATLPPARGLGDHAAVAGNGAALTAHARFVAHLTACAASGDPRPALGAPALARLMSAEEATSVDLSVLAREAERERARILDILADACQRHAPGQPLAETVAAVRAEYPAPESLIATIRSLAGQAIAWTRDHDIIGGLDGICEAGPMPRSQRLAAAGLFGSGPYEPDSPGRFYLSVPDPAWPATDQHTWMASYFSYAALPGMAIHEVAPGHFAHSRVCRRVNGDVRRTLTSEAFSEGWAHYCEELAVEEGFHRDARGVIGFALDALKRIGRLNTALSVHTGELSAEEAAPRNATEAFVSGPAARSEAVRALYHPTYGCYAWGKLVIRRVREQARCEWGDGFTLARFHQTLLALGPPPIGLLPAAISLAPILAAP